MKVGLLVCDTVKPAYQPTFGDYPDMFQALFPNYEFDLFFVNKGQFPSSVDDCEVYMATGSSHSVYENLEWINQTKTFIRKLYTANKYFIGFCFGHQLLAEALGGIVKKAAIGWCVGIHEFRVLQIKRWMRPAKTHFNILMMCQDQVVILPKGATRLAGNEACPNAVLQIGNRMMSFQGHPEFTRAYDKILMEGRIERMGVEKVTQGINSLALDLDLDLFRSWVDNFVKG